MKVKLRKRAISLLLVLLMLVSSFTPFAPHIIYAVDAGPNDNDAGGEKKAATLTTTTYMVGVPW